MNYIVGKLRMICINSLNKFSFSTSKIVRFLLKEHIFPVNFFYKVLKLYDKKNNLYQFTILYLNSNKKSSEFMLKGKTIRPMNGAVSQRR